MRKIAALASLICLMLMPPAFALDEIYSPNAEYREISIGYSGSRTFDNNSTKNNSQGHQVSIEAGLTPRWTMEVSGVLAKEPDNALKMQATELESRFQFFEAGENWLDSGLLVAYGQSTQSHLSSYLETKLLLQKDVGMFTSTANVGFNQNVGKNAGSSGADYVLLWNTRYRYNAYFQPGIELQSDFGHDSQLGNVNEQQHYLGAAAYGKLLGNIKYQVGYFVGLSDAASQSAARVLFEYEVHF